MRTTGQMAILLCAICCFFCDAGIFQQPAEGGLVFAAPLLQPARVNESHVFDGG